MKQSKLRKRRVWRYAILYFVMLVLFLALLVGPIVAGSKILSPSLVKNIPLELYQPVGLNNNDTRGRTETGTGAVSGAATATSTVTAKIRLF
jgi:1,3-beta-glucan synthase